MSFEAGPKRVVTPLLTTPLVNSGGGKIVSEKKGEPFSGLLSLNFPFFTSGGTSGAYRGMGDPGEGGKSGGGRCPGSSLDRAASGSGNAPF